MEMVRRNSRLILAGIIVLAVVLLAANDSNNKQSTDEQKDQSTSSTQSNAEVEEVAKTITPATVEEPIGKQPIAGPVVVDQVEDSYSAIVRKGDNQTVIVRQMLNEFLQDRSQSLSAEQRLYVETVLVDALPRNDVIFPDQVIQLKADILAGAVQKSSALTEVQLNAWAQYL